jgi:hypothetical protein
MRAQEEQLKKRGEKKKKGGVGNYLRAQEEQFVNLLRQHRAPQQIRLTRTHTNTHTHIRGAVRELAATTSSSSTDPTDAHTNTHTHTILSTSIFGIQFGT